MNFKVKPDPRITNDPIIGDDNESLLVMNVSFFVVIIVAAIVVCTLSFLDQTSI